ncbi:hypothetical protein ACQPU1_01925 [Clostridium paraputrificum]|uniref:hypothetical protein n=1 Tax=Clostridium TaxID=1485 RepID=UPI003D33FF26
MSFYYVNDKVDEKGQHEVHEEGCSKMPNEMYRTFLGDFGNEIEAVESSIRNCYFNSDGCYFCCREANRD